MVSLTELYNIKETTFERLQELKSTRDPARGNKGKNREKDYYFVDEPADPETGRVTSKVVRKVSLSNMFKDLEAEIQDFEEIIKDKPDDTVLYNISEELKEIFNTFRTHVRKNYPEEYKKVNEGDLDEMNTTGSGASFNSGNGMGYFGKKKKKVNEEEEEELSRDVKVLEKLLSDKINTKDEWVDMFQLLMTHSEEINGLNDSTIRSLLQQSMKEL